MYEEMRVKYLFINMRYPAYVKLQVVTIIGGIIGALLLFFLARDSQYWVLKNGWWILAVASLLEVGETFLAIKRAKKQVNQ